MSTSGRGPRAAAAAAALLLAGLLLYGLLSAGPRRVVVDAAAAEHVEPLDTATAALRAKSLHTELAETERRVRQLRKAGALLANVPASLLEALEEEGARWGRMDGRRWTDEALANATREQVEDFIRRVRQLRGK
eukprot:TRINITY_DN2353_c2_g1_i1.p2 TRINITY_DN2353_c2_g1~~TRINITY_DN2353_c2_g1_i1.p2  ORF type:complete len:155 (+),score=55.92 TRINITY_DN2353_c2_g1_i1:66-467(+)